MKRHVSESHERRNHVHDRESRKLSLDEKIK
jgi:hypothetical protein